MKKIKIHRRAILVSIGMFCSVIATSALVSYWTGSARAGGIPTSNPLYYSGLLTDKTGKVLTGSKAISVVLWNAVTAGNKKCTTAAKTTNLVQGRFRVALDKTCIKAVQDNSDLWVEVVVDGTSMGRTKIGAVPYAVEAQRVAEPDCPPGYTRDNMATNIVLCKRGKDEMVKVGDFWVDRYEMSIVDKLNYNEGLCDNLKKSGSTPTGYANQKDDYPATFPDNGEWTVPLYACSVKNAYISHFMTWFQAAQSCASSGKHLCTNSEWQVAATGTPESKCAVNATVVQDSGSRSLCVSKYGAVDMVGNLWEWVAWWGQTGPVSTTFAAGAKATPWPDSPFHPTLNINGQARSLIKSPPYAKDVVGIPAAALRGGGYNSNTEAGIFTMDLSKAPSYQTNAIGARCCRR